MEAYQSKSEELGKIIERLYTVNNKADCEEICKELDAIYLNKDGEMNENFRHEYASISRKIRELSKMNTEAGLPIYQMDYLMQNIKAVYDYAVEQEKPYVKSLFKLKDHIGLEAGRIALVEQLRWDIVNSKESVAIQLEDLNALADELNDQVRESSDLISKFQEQSQQSEEKLQEIDKKSVDMVEKIEGVQKESITILGIFASIVLSFTAGIGFSSSVLQHMDKGSPYRIAAVITAIAFVLMNLMAIMLGYIDKIRKVSEEKLKYPGVLIGLDALAAAVWILDFIAFKLKLLG